MINSTGEKRCADRSIQSVGGYKESGFGREGGRQGLLRYLSLS
jgi:acyl-CoA reductase-like NAD-dependent aldehyde dehydrogenase